MSEFKITGPGFYRTRDGKKAYVAGPAVGGWRFVGMGNEDNFYKELWDADGRRVTGAGTPEDLIAPWTEPKKGTVWVNVYDDHFMTYTTRDYADRHAVSGRLACVSVNWTEGEGL
jgi:hypothetical protein